VLTLFSTCKPFRGEFQRIQTNALRSWAKLRPGCDALVFGDEPGVAAICEELGMRQIPEVARTTHGAPILCRLFAEAEKRTSRQYLCFVNADVMLTTDILSALEQVRHRWPQFLLVVRRWNVDLHQEWDFGASDWEDRLRNHARNDGVCEPVFGGMDVFVFPRGMWRNLPPYAVGRRRWDSALVYEARMLGVPVVDATDVVTCVHQNHGYAHHPNGTAGVFKGPEAVRNTELLGGDEYIFTALNATHVLTASGLRRRMDLNPLYVLRKLAVGPALYPVLRPLAPLVRSLAPVWRRIRQYSFRR
jgi:hypothetical protein